MPTQDYGEIFCEAVSELVAKRLEELEYDKTMLCTIVDDSQRDKGIYKVSNGSASFEAHSEKTDYYNGLNVYVSVPQGKMNEQKIIIGKKTQNEKEAYNYKSPFDTYVDVTNNLFSGSIRDTGIGLLANDDDPNKLVTRKDKDGNELQETIRTIWEYNIPEENQKADCFHRQIGQDYKSYTRLGLKASFQSWLDFIDKNGEQSYATQGQYGLRLKIWSSADSTATDTSDTQQEELYVAYLDEKDFNGDPYNFQSFYPQEKIINISDLNTIKKMVLEFYQVSGTFKNDNGELVPVEKDFGDSKVWDNLYIRDIHISLGYDLSEFNGEKVDIYTLDSPTYYKSVDPKFKNFKKLQLRWIHKNDNGEIVSINQNSSLDYEVRWYRYSMGAPAADEYSGVYWKLLSTQKRVNGEWEYKIEDPEWKEFNKGALQEEYREPGFFYSWSLPNTVLASETYKAFVIYNGTAYKSSQLVFTSDGYVPNPATVEVVQALNIDFEDNSSGNYRIYNKGNKLIDQSQSNIERELVPMFTVFEGVTNPTPEVLDEATWIEWIIPKNNTMIVLDNHFKGNEADVDEAGNVYRIRRYGTGPKSNELKDGRNKQKYRIKSYYSQGDSNNTIQCKIMKEGIEYTATTDLTFGMAGTAGTQNTLVLEFDDNATGLSVKDNKVITVSAKLYDYENNEVDLSDTNPGNGTPDDQGFYGDWKWCWYKDKATSSQIDINNAPEKEVFKKALQLKSSYKTLGETYNILQVSLKYNGMTLTAHLPIPIKSDEKYTYIQGTSQIWYNSKGELEDFYKNKYRLYENSTLVDENTVTWTVKSVNQTTENQETDYTPTIKNNELVPVSFFVEGMCDEVCVTASIGGSVVWSQPIYSFMNRYPVAMLDNWDGSLSVGENDPGTIMAPRLVAGKKNIDDNTFSGVIMGDWEKTDAENNITKQTGIYGFRKGEQTYGFLEDGTAFIGPAGGGRILFDGKKSTIKSASYDEDGKPGILLDLDDANFIAKINDNYTKITPGQILNSTETYGVNQIMIYGGALYSHSTKWTESENGYNSAHTGTTTIQGGAISQQIGNFPDGFYDSNKVGFTQYGENIFIKQGGKNASIHNEGNYSSITNGILGNIGTYIKNIGTDGSNAGEITLRGGTILLHGSYNAFLRASRGDQNYYKIIGLDSTGSLAIGQDITNGNKSTPYIGGSTPENKGDFDKSLNVKIYTAGSIDIIKNGIGGQQLTDPDNFGSHSQLSAQTVIDTTNGIVKNPVYSNYLYAPQYAQLEVNGTKYTETSLRYVTIGQAGNFIPHITNTMALGQPSRIWKDLYTDKLNGQKIGSLAYADFVSKNLNVTLQGTTYISYPPPSKQNFYLYLTTISGSGMGDGTRCTGIGWQPQAVTESTTNNVKTSTSNVTVAAPTSFDVYVLTTMLGTFSGFQFSQPLPDSEGNMPYYSKYSLNNTGAIGLDITMSNYFENVVFTSSKSGVLTENLAANTLTPSINYLNI